VYFAGLSRKQRRSNAGGRWFCCGHCADKFHKEPRCHERGCNPGALGAPHTLLSHRPQHTQTVFDICLHRKITRLKGAKCTCSTKPSLTRTQPQTALAIQSTSPNWVRSTIRFLHQQGAGSLCARASHLSSRPEMRTQTSRMRALPVLLVGRALRSNLAHNARGCGETHRCETCLPHPIPRLSSPCH
jgi:hypothetical protein